MTEKIFFLSVLVLGIFGFKNCRKKFYFWFVILPFLLFQFWYGISEQRKQAARDFWAKVTSDEILKGTRDSSDGIKELNEKNQKGALTIEANAISIARYLESINQTLKQQASKGLREWVAAYHDQVGKIPPYFNSEEWGQSEKLIYDLMVKEIVGGFASRNMSNSPGQAQVLEVFQKERNRVVDAKKRAFNVAS